jgi:shikimate kinase
MHPNIYLIGMPGAGKTTVGKLLAKRMGATFIDVDREIVNRTGVTIASIFEIEGEAAFRARESALIAELVQRENTVIATGGGAILAEANRKVLRANGHVVYLKARLDELWERTRRDTNRPLLAQANPQAVLAALFAVREPLYKQTAHLAVETGRQSVGRLADYIISELQPQIPTDDSATK